MDEKNCDYRDGNIATVWCNECKVRLCQNCDYLLHTVGSKGQSHLLTKLWTNKNKKEIKTDIKTKATIKTITMTKKKTKKNK